MMNPIPLFASGIFLTVTSLLGGYNPTLVLGAVLATNATTTFITSTEEKKKTKAALQNFETVLAKSTENLQMIQEIKEELKNTNEIIAPLIATTEEKKKTNATLQNLETGLAKSTEMEKELKNTNEIIAKLTKQDQTIETSNRLIVGQVQKTQHQQKVITVTINHQKQQLENLSAQPPVNQPPQIEQPILPVPSQKRQIHSYISIDGNNLTKTAKELGLKIDWKALKIFLAEQAKETDAFTLKYYTGLRKNQTSKQCPKFKHLTSLQYEVFTYPLSQQSDGTWKTKGDDMGIGVDLMDSVQSGDQVILMIGDGDFIPLIEKLLARQAHVTVIGASFNTSLHIRKLEDHRFKFICLESIREQIT